jgi:exopolyphosphatase/guanosine-5'-triphosphate,3'-diphosphate pyrophosphatase
LLSLAGFEVTLIGRFWVTAEEVRLFHDKTVTERKKIPGLEPKRADVIIASACLIERIMIFFPTEEVIVSDQGVRYGLLYEQLD